MSSQYGEVGPLTAKIGLPVWDTPANFNGFRVLPFFCTDVAQRRSTKLCTMFGVWPSPGLVHYMYIFGGFCPITEFYQVQNSLCVQVLRSPIFAAFAGHSSSRRQPNFAAFSRGCHVYSTGRSSRRAWPTF